MKKFLSILLTAVMLLTVALPIFAVTSTGAFKVGSTYYQTFTEAYNAVAANGTIYMVSDYYAGTKDADNNPTAGEAMITVDKSFTLTTENDAEYTFSNAKREDSNLSNFVMTLNASGITVKISNINFDIARGINVIKGTLELDNVSIVANRRTAIKADDGSDATIKVNNSTIKVTSECTGTDTSKQEPAILLDSVGTTKLYVTGNTQIIRASENNTGGNAAVILVSGAGATTVSLGSGTQLQLNHAAKGTNNTACGLYLGGTGIATVTLENGSSMVANTSLPTLKFVTGSQVAYFTDNGCSFLVASALTTTPDSWASALGDTYNFVVDDATTVSGYKAYKADSAKGEAYFGYIGENDAAGTASTLSSAITLAKSGSVITLLKDCTSDFYEMKIDKPLEFDLNGNTYTATVAGKYLFNNITANFIVKNGTMDIQRGFVVYNNGKLTLDDVTCTTASGAMIKLSGAGNAHAIINDSSLTQATTGEPLVLVENTCDGQLDLTGSTVLKTTGGINANKQNCGIICVQQAWGTNVDSKIVASNTDLVLNVGSEASLIAAHASNTNTGYVASVIVDQTYGNIVVNFEKGATVKIDRTSGGSKNAIINEIYTTTEGNAEGSSIVNDNGANFILCADAAKAGITLPASLLGYAVGDTVITDVNYKNESATDYVTLTKVQVMINMNKGASIRTSLPYGIRFGASIDADQYATLLELDPNATLGFVLAKANVAGDNFNVSELDADDYVIYDARNIVLDETAGVYTFNTTMYEGDTLFTKANQTNLTRTYAARAFIKLTIDGEEIYYWADFSKEDNSRSIYFVAKSYYEDSVNGSTTDVVINHILETCGYEA